MRGNWCRDSEAGCPSCRQPVLKTSTGPHPFFNHQQTPEARDVDVWYVCYQTLVPILNTIQRKSESVIFKHSTFAECANLGFINDIIIIIIIIIIVLFHNYIYFSTP